MNWFLIHKYAKLKFKIELKCQDRNMLENESADMSAFNKNTQKYSIIRKCQKQKQARFNQAGKPT